MNNDFFVEDFTQDNHLYKNGSLDTCKSCSGIKCCGNIHRGGALEPPFLCRYDLKRIERYTGLNKNLFTEPWVNPNTGNTILFMKIKKDNKCFFLDPEEGKCRIYAIRPIDCKLFPLDIEKFGDKYYWIQYKYKYCNLSEGDKQWLFNFKDTVVQIFGKELLDYATIRVPGMDKIGYDEIGQVVGV